MFTLGLTAGEPDRAIGGVPPCGREGIGDASRAVASARGMEPTMDGGPWASSADMPGGLESVRERYAMFAMVSRVVRGRFSGYPHSIGAASLVCGRAKSAI